MGSAEPSFGDSDQGLGGESSSAQDAEEPVESVGGREAIVARQRKSGVRRKHRAAEQTNTAQTGHRRKPTPPGCTQRSCEHELEPTAQDGGRTVHARRWGINRSKFADDLRHVAIAGESLAFDADEDAAN
jgi:hypothetical protein